MRRPLCMVCLLFVTAVFLYVHLCPPKAGGFDEYDGKTVCLTGKVYQKECRPAIFGGDNYLLYLNQVAVSGEASSRKTAPDFESAKADMEHQNKIQGVVCYMEKYCDVPLGSRVVVEGEMQEFMHATNPGEFDSREYYRILKLDFRLKNARLIRKSEKYNKFHELFYKIKEFCAKILDKSFNSDDAGIMKAVLLGDKNSLSEDVKELYKRNGIMHIMAISGLHISMLGMGLYRILKKLKIPGTAAAITCVIVMWCYGIMTGMSVSACRAVIMFGMKLTAEMIGRTYDMLTALAVSAVLLLAEQPLYVKHSGFLLSFGAIIGIGVVLPCLEEAGFRYRKNTGITEMHILEKSVFRPIGERLQKGLLSGIAIFLVSFPIQIYFYYQYSVYSILLNLFIIPLMTLVMLSGLAVLLTGIVEMMFSMAVIGSTAGRMFAAVGHIVLKFYTLSCEGAEGIPGAVWITGRPKTVQIVFYYGILCFVLLLCRKEFWGSAAWEKVFRKKSGRFPERSALVKKMSLGISIVLLAACVGILGFRVERGLEITFLDVGQGDCIYVRTAGGSRYLIDGGSTSKSKVGKYQITPFLKSRGVDCLDMVFVSHGDKDHYSGIEELLKNTASDRIKLQCLVLPVTAARDGDEETEGCKKLEQLAWKQGIRVAYMQAGDKIMSDILKMDCLNPVSVKEGEQNSSEDKNEQSQVLYLTYKDFSALFTGDITGESEEAMEERLKTIAGNRPLTVLKVAHHGSEHSTDAEFLRTVKPFISIISCGEKNSYGHPHKELLDRLEESGTRIYKTTESGAVTVWTDGKRVEIESFLP